MNITRYLVLNIALNSALLHSSTHCLNSSINARYTIKTLICAGGLIGIGYYGHQLFQSMKNQKYNQQMMKVSNDNMSLFPSCALLLMKLITGGILPCSISFLL